MNPSKMVLVINEEEKVIFTLPVVSKLHNQRRVLNQLFVLMNRELPVVSKLHNQRRVLNQLFVLMNREYF